VRDTLGEGVHTSLRKAGDSPEATQAWLAIRDMDQTEWERILAYLWYGLEPIILAAFEAAQEQVPELPSISLAEKPYLFDPSNRFRRLDKREAYERALLLVGEIPPGSLCSRTIAGFIGESQLTWKAWMDDLADKWPELGREHSREVLRRALWTVRTRILRQRQDEERRKHD